MVFKSFKESSKANWGRKMLDSEQATNEEIQLGAMLRIADSMELMASDRLRMEKDLDWYKKKYKERGEEVESLRRSRAAYIGKLNNMREGLRVAKERIAELEALNKEDKL